MPKVITISEKEADDTFVAKAPAEFRFALANDFHNKGIRKQYVEVFILKWGNPATLTEYWFSSFTPVKWLQWLLNNKRVFIRIGDRAGDNHTLVHFVIPTDEYLTRGT